MTTGLLLALLLTAQGGLDDPRFPSSADQAAEFLEEKKASAPRATQMGIGQLDRVGPGGPRKAPVRTEDGTLLASRPKRYGATRLGKWDTGGPCGFGERWRGSPRRDRRDLKQHRWMGSKN